MSLRTLSSPKKIAVVLPFYNEEKTITQTLHSFLYAPFIREARFILVDNNSTDNSLKKINAFQKKHPEVVIDVLFEKKRGVIFARKTAFRHAVSCGSSVVMSTDADTIFNPNALKEVLAFAFGRKTSVFFGPVTLDLEHKLLRYVYFPDFAKLSNVLWSIEREIFGYYFYGAYFAIRTQHLAEILPVYDVEKSLVIYQKSGEDILLSRRSCYLGGSIQVGKHPALTSSRRFLSDPLSWVTARRNNDFRDSPTHLLKESSTLVNKNKAVFYKKRLRQTLTRWFRYWVDALYFREAISGEYPALEAAVHNFASLFGIQKLPKLTGSPFQTLVAVRKQHYQKALEIIDAQVRERLQHD